jgi:hypothetical protein
MPMTEREHIEEQIRELLTTETSGIILSNKLFAPGGLFGLLGATEEERRAVVQTSLFRQAQARISELQRKEAAEFARVVEQAQAAALGKEFLFRLEPTKKP